MTVSQEFAPESVDEELLSYRDDDTAVDNELDGEDVLQDPGSRRAATEEHLEPDMEAGMNRVAAAEEARISAVKQ